MKRCTEKAEARCATYPRCEGCGAYCEDAGLTLSQVALKFFGVDRQVRKLCEEMAELQEAVCKTLDGKDN